MRYFFLHEIILLSVACTLSFTALSAHASDKLPATVTWIGNSYPGGDGKHVPQDIDALCATPDGRVFSNTPWEEGGGNVTEFKDGKVLGSAGHTHGWGNTGGRAIACNGKYLYIGCRMENEGGGLNDLSTWPPKGKTWLGISRRPLDDIRKAAPFEGGKGGKGDTLKGCFLVVNEVNAGNAATDLPGIATDDMRLYVSSPSDNTIKIYDAETMAKIDEWKIERTGPIALAKDGTLWMLQTKTGDAPARLTHFDAAGKALAEPLSLQLILKNPYDIGPRTYEASSIPSNITVNREGRILIPDRGETQQIRVFDGMKELRPIGEQASDFLPSATEFGDLRFFNPSAVACDGAGNFYFAQHGSTGGGSTILESYDAQLKPRWRLFGLEFVDMADVDPADDTQIYTKEERFKYDYSKSGAEAWQYQGSSIAPLGFPHDSRLHIWSAGVWMRRVGGSKFLFINDMNAENLQVLRMYGKIAWPLALIAKQHIKTDDKWPPNQPAKGEWIWFDKGKFGLFEAGDYESRDTDAPAAQGWWVDDNGGVWLVTEKAELRYFPMANGVPSWSYATMQTWPHPAEFAEVKRIRYDVKTDVLYLGGTTVEHKNQHWKPMGPVIARYDGWLKGDRKLRWQITAPYQKGAAGHESCEPMGFDVAGDYLFVPYTGAGKDLGYKTGHIEVFRASDGASVGHMEPGANIGEIGLQDIRECLRAHQRKDGEYIVFLEEDYKAKILMYRWKP